MRNISHRAVVVNTFFKYFYFKIKEGAVMANTKELILELMKEKNIKSLRQLENIAGISNNIISKWDRMQPNAENLSKVAKVLGVSPDYLLHGEQSEAEKAYRAEIEKTPIAFAIGENEVILLETFRELSKAGKLRILAKLSEEFDKENKQAEPVPDSQKE